MSRYVYLPGAILRIVISAWIDKENFTVDSGTPNVYYRVPDQDDVPPFILVNSFFDSESDYQDVSFMRPEQATMTCVVSENDGVHGAMALKTFLADMFSKQSVVSDINKFIELSERKYTINIPYRFKQVNLAGSDDEVSWDDQGKRIQSFITISYQYTYSNESFTAMSDADYSDYL